MAVDLGRHMLSLKQKAPEKHRRRNNFHYDNSPYVQTYVHMYVCMYVVQIHPTMVLYIYSIQVFNAILFNVYTYT